LPSTVRVGTRQSRCHRFLRRDGSFSLPSAVSALGKSFAECPTNGSRQRLLCQLFFPECPLPSAALGKAPESCSDMHCWVLAVAAVGRDSLLIFIRGDLH